MSMDETVSKPEPQIKPRANDSAAESQTKSPITRFLPILVIVAVLIGGYLAGLHTYFTPSALNENKEAIDAFVRENLLLAAFTYMVIYIIAVSVSFPGASLLTLAGGAIFGWFLGGSLAIIGATIGAAIIFLVAKTSLGDMLAEKAGPRMTKLRDGFQKDAFNYLLTLRLAPVVPFWITNLAPALFGMDLGRYVIATFFGIIPGGFAYAFIGEQVGASFDKDSSIVTNVTLGLAALAVASIIPLVVKRWRAGKNETTSAP